MTAQSLLLGSSGASWDISLAVYSGKSLSIATQDSDPVGVALSGDGTSAYALGGFSNTLYQYTLSTPFDISTGSYASKSMSTNAGGAATQSEDVFFKPDGLSAYVVSVGGDAVFQYTLTIAWDLSTGSYASKSLSLAGQETSPRGIVISADGTSLFVVGATNKTIYQYTLSTPWDVSTGSYSGKSFSVAAQDTVPLGLGFKYDGSIAYIVGAATARIYQYQLSTGWDISTASYVNKSFLTSSQDSTMKGITFSPLGTPAYICGSQFDKIYQYTLP